MQVIISVPGVFNAFHLGRQLEQRDALKRIYTSFPRFAIDTSGIPRSKVHPVRRAELIMQLGERFPALNSVVPTTSPRPFVEWKLKTLDRAVARRLDSVNDGLFLGFSGCSLRSIRRANDLGFTTAVERTSSHSRTQARILEREYHQHGLDSPLSEYQLEREEQEYEAADYVITPSEFVYESFLEQEFDEAKLRCVPFGTDIPEGTGSDTAENEFYFLFSGHINLRKGFPYLMEAWDRLSIDATLILAGGIDDTMKHIVESYENDDSVRFLGWVEDLAAWYDRADVFVFPSLEEGSARVTYEAMAHGLPVVTTFNSGWVGEDGIHGVEIPIRDPESLASVMERMYENTDERQRMGAAAEQLIRENYTRDDYGDRIYRTYESLLD